MEDEQEDLVDFHFDVKPQANTVKMLTRYTSSMMTRAEATQAIGIRAEMIANGNPVLTDGVGITNAQDLATKELYDGKSPLILIREYNGYREEFRVAEMRLPSKFREDFPVIATV